MVGNQCEVRNFAVPGGGEAEFRNSKREIIKEWLELRQKTSNYAKRYRSPA